MPKTESGELGELAKMLIDEIDSDAAAIADTMFGEIATVDGVALTKQEARDYIRNGWPNPKFRADLLEQLGEKGLFQAAYDAGLTTLTVKQQMDIARTMAPLLDKPKTMPVPEAAPSMPLSPPQPAPMMAGGVAPLQFPPPQMGALQ